MDALRSTTRCMRASTRCPGLTRRSRSIVLVPKVPKRPKPPQTHPIQGVLALLAQPENMLRQPIRQDQRIAKAWVPEEIPPAPPVAPTQAEKRQIRTAQKQVAAKMPAPEVRIGQDAHGHPVLGLPHTDEAGWQAQMKAAFGTTSGAFVDAEILRLLTALRATRDDLPLETKVNAALAVIAGIAPRNEVEAMLAVQMAMTHIAAMRMLTELNRLNPHVSPGGVAIAGTVSAKLLRAFAGQAEALAKLRRPAEQVVRVERVNISAGGQAIVGTVTHPRHGGYPENQDQPYGTEHERAREPAAGTQVWSEEAGRLALPEAEGQGADTLSAARRGTGQRRTQR